MTGRFQLLWSVRMALVALLTFLCIEAFAVPAFHSDAYVTVQHGHLERDGKRLRVWGVNVQSGVFKSYAEIDDLLDRIELLGFNAIRIWPTSGTFYEVRPGAAPHFNVSVRGDRSDLDRFDYLVAGASQRGINIQMTMLHYLDVPFLKSAPESGIAEIIRSTNSDAMIRRLHGFAPYVSADYRARLKQHMQWLLARNNPYTGRKYVDEPAVSAWELANEANFVHCAIKPSCLKELPPIAIAYLNAAWLASPHNSNGVSLPTRLEEILTPPLFTNYGRFVVDQFIAVSQELKEFARRVGGPDSGIDKQPFIFNTDPGERTALSHYAYSSGDVYSASAYASPLSAVGLHAPWSPYVAGRAVIPALGHIKVKDKPFVVYEASFFRPYAFRAEWGVVLAAMALKQDWDGAFLYSYGQPGVIYDLDGNTVRYGNRALPTPVPGDKGERGQYIYGFHHGGDPIAMASWSIGGRLFLGGAATGIEPEVVWDVPLEGVFKPGGGYPAFFLNPVNTLETPRKKTMAVRFVNSGAVCSPCVRSNAKPTDVFVGWDTSAARLMVRTPTGQVVAGELDGDLGVLWGGIAALVSKPGFGVVAVMRGQNGKGDRLQVIGNAENTGYAMDSSRVNFSGPAGAMAGMLARGGAPVVYSGPTIRFLLPQSVQSYVEFDFNFVKTVPVAASESYEFFPSSRVFGVDVNYREKVQP